MRLSIIGVEIDERPSSSRTAEYLGWGGSLDDFATRPIWASYSRSPMLLKSVTLIERPRWVARMSERTKHQLQDGRRTECIREMLIQAAIPAQHCGCANIGRRDGCINSSTRTAVERARTAVDFANAV